MRKQRVKTLTEVRKEIRTGVSFSVTYCTFDEARGTGGERVSIDKCILVKGSDNIGAENIHANATQGSPEPSSANRNENSKNPHHLLHGTFNVQRMDMEKRKIHWLLIEELNGFQVVL